MRTKALLVLVALIGLLSIAQPAAAVQYGSPDGTAHPYVGLVVFYDANKVPLWRCTGTQISPTVLLTAGHCTGLDPALGFGPTFAQVWFDPGPLPLDPLWDGGACTGMPFTAYPCAGGFWGTPQPHPLWNGFLTIPNTHDVGVVTFDTPISMSQYGQLAPAGYLDSLLKRRGLQNTKFTVVGYGLQLVKPVQIGLRERYVATVSLVNLNSALNDGYNVQQSSDPGQGNGPGGTCFGDSGGPVFSTNASGQLVVVAVNSFVLNSNCKGSGFGHRVDIPDSRDFLADYVTLP